MMKPLENIGPYRITHILGQGGMGIVYQGEHEITGAKAAVKTVRPGSEYVLQGIRKEIRILAKIKHPGIVRIIQEGVQDGLPWYAMEWLAGESLRAFIARIWGVSDYPGPGDHPRDNLKSPSDSEDEAEKPVKWWTSSFSLEDILAASPVREETDILSSPDLRQPVQQSCREDILRSVLEITKLLCEALAFLHGEGVVHRDFKPENIIITEQGIPVLMDFGLMTHFSPDVTREMLHVDHLSMGTAHYMAPEQIRGDFVDARADLYALGCIMFEMVSGHKPFSGSMERVLNQHLEAKPPSPSKYVKDLPPQLESIILRLMHKDPRKRIGYAEDIARLMSQIGIKAQFPGEFVRPRAYLYRPRFTGREEHITFLSQLVAQLEKGIGHVIFVEGESGVGKTRLGLELVRISHWRELRVFTGNSSASAPQPLEPFQQLFQFLLDRRFVIGRGLGTRLSADDISFLRKHGPSILHRESGRPEQPVSDTPAVEDKQRLFTLFIKILKALSEEKPLLVIIDDLQWIDEVTIEFLAFITAQFTQTTLPLMIVGMYREEEASRSLLNLVKQTGIQRVRLSRLEEHGISSIICDMLALSVAPVELSTFLTRYSRGNPFFITEYLRTAMEENLVWKNKKGNWKVGFQKSKRSSLTEFAELELPHSILDLIALRIKRLPQNIRVIANAAAVLGYELRAFLLQEVSEVAEADFLDALAELIRQQILEHGAPGVFSFVHAKIRGVVYDLINEDEKSILHRRAAHVMEQYFAEIPIELQPILANHWERAGEPEKAKPHYLYAARYATNRYIYKEAERLYRSYLRLTDEPDQECIKVHNDFGRFVLQIQGKIKAAREQFETALELSRELNDQHGQAESLQSLAWVDFAIAGNMEKAQARFDTAYKLAKELKAEELVGSILVNMANLHHAQGNFMEARDYYREALDVQRKVNHIRGEAKILSNLAALHKQQGQIDTATQLYEQALDVNRRVGNKAYEGVILGSLANLRQIQGQIDAALALYDQALTINRETGARHSELINSINLASFSLELKNYDRAQKLFEDGLLITRAIGNKRLEGAILGNLGSLHHERGEVEKTVLYYNKALAIHREVGNPLFEAYTLCLMATLERQTCGSFEVRKENLEAAEKIITDKGHAFAQVTYYCEKGHHMLSQYQSARPHLAAAMETIETLKAGPESRLQKSIDRLQRAQQALDEGNEGLLFNGELKLELSEGMRIWLDKHGYLDAEG